MNIYELIDRMSREHKTIFDMPLKVTFYARVSTHRDEQLNSQENQIQTFTELIKNNHNWTLVDGYIDTIRGESAANRDNFQRMIADAKSGQFDLIICKEISRFSRDLLDSISYTRELFRNNVGVYFTSDNLCTIDRDSELRLGIMASIAQEEVSRLSERVKFGHKKAIENGTVMGNSRIFGYTKKNGKLVIDEREGKMIDLIYNLYATGDYSLRDLGDVLYQKGFKNHSGNIIAHTTIKSIIQNPKYKGYYCGNKVKVLDFRTKKQRFLPQDQWLMYKDETGETVPAIVSEELWDTCNQMLKKRCHSETSGNQGGKRFTSPLSGKIICGHCGKSFHHNSYGHGRAEVKWHWVCQVKKRKASDCPSFSIKDDEMLEILKEFFKKFVSNMDEYIEKYIKLYEEQSQLSDSSTMTEKIKKEIIKLEKKRDKLFDLYTDDIISKTDYKERNDSLQSQIIELKRDLSELSKQSDKVHECVKRLAEIKNYFSLQDLNAMSDTLAYELSKTIIDKVIIQPISATEQKVIIVPFLGEQSEIPLNHSLTCVTNGHISKKMIPILTQEYVRETLNTPKVIQYQIHLCIA